MSVLSDEYEFCSKHGDKCYLPPGLNSVAYAYGDNPGAIHYRTVRDDINCKNNKFGASKHHDCYYYTLPTEIAQPPIDFYDENGDPAGWKVCASEGGSCNPGKAYPVDILYGSERKFNYANAFLVDCNNDTMGDPNKGAKKKCFWREPTFTPVTPPTDTTTPDEPAPEPAPQPAPEPAPQPANPPANQPVVPTSSSSNNWIYFVFGIVILVIIVFVVIYFMKKNKSQQNIDVNF